MAYLRSAIYFVFMVVTVIPWALAVVIAAPFVSGQTVYRMCVNWLTLCIHAARAICGVRWRVTGLEHLPTAGDTTAAVLLACKHQSTWETFALPGLMPHPLAYVFKRELLYVPFFGWAMSRMEMVHIDRSKRTEAWAKVLRQGKTLMAKGIWVIMFPEGTRIARGQQGEYKTGASRLAIACRTPIVPIAVSSARCWPRKSFLLRPGLVEVSVGRPIPSVGRDPAGLMKEVEAWIEAEMRRIDPEAYAAPPPA